MLSSGIPGQRCYADNTRIVAMKNKNVISNEIPSAVRRYIREFQRFHEDHTRRINRLGEFTANGSRIRQRETSLFTRCTLSFISQLVVAKARIINQSNFGTLPFRLTSQSIYGDRQGRYGRP